MNITAPAINLRLKNALAENGIYTIVLDSGLQISGNLSNIKFDGNNQPFFLIFSGPSQLCFKNKELQGHSIDYHSHGYSTPVGEIQNMPKALQKLSPAEVESFAIIIGERLNFNFTSGIKVNGIVKDLTYIDNQLKIISFTNCSVTYNSEKLFQPEWGIYDLALGHSIADIFQGHADHPHKPQS